MGGTMAEALLEHGYKVCGFDIDAKAKNRFKKYGGQFLTHASDVAASADIVIVSVATSKALEQVTQAIVDGQRTRKTKTPPIVIETSTLTMTDKNLCAKLLKSNHYGIVHQVIEITNTIRTRFTEPFKRPVHRPIEFHKLLLFCHALRFLFAS